jgi:hypothetical protein
LCDAELLVDGEKKIAADVDLEALKRILEHKETFKAEEHEA